MFPYNDKLNEDDGAFQDDLYRYLKQMGRAFPDTMEELDHFLHLIDQKNIITNDFPSADEILGRGFVELGDFNPSTDEEIEENLAQAAREGGEIPPDVIEQMNKDRKKREEEEDQDE